MTPAEYRPDTLLNRNGKRKLVHNWMYIAKSLYGPYGYYVKRIWWKPWRWNLYECPLHGDEFLLAHDLSTTAVNVYLDLLEVY